MPEQHLGISQQTLVSNNGDQALSAKKWPQYTASLASTLGALAAGMVLAWSSSAGDKGIELQKVYGVPVSEEEFSWIGSISTLGAGAICIPIGILADFIGRKTSMLLMVVFFSVGWLLIIFADSVAMFCIGRFITGLSSGAFCVAAPMYAAEIAEKEIRGTLGAFFQLLLTVGILLSYILGNYVDIRELSIISAVVPLIFFAIFVFMPESPIYYLKKGDEDSARKSLIRLRGAHYDADGELQAHKNAMEEDSKNMAPFWTVAKSRATIKAFIIAYGLMLFQQLSGVNAVIFYTSSIFGKAGSSLSSGSSTMIVGAMQVVAAFVSSLVVDRAGRKILLLVSIIFMCLSSCTLGVYFYLDDHAERATVDSITWLPLVSVCVFIIMFNMGFGPVPWTMVGELFAPEVKSVVAGSACLFNWLLAFIVTKFFSNLSTGMGLGPTFWLFSGICLIGCAFVGILVPETKGKSLEQIQRELNGL
ncbi:facilitated trehalose transporter Tret1-like [Ceratina calcarata]|uniref:Facilitated trehalose transporter Tret1-like n=1 Tax=Ceratina calcarata TaxID=156304 RepID=A0AAJ7IWP1_9HYME|nr:facilitated trehalose transporter Tret1-like [Ceratina calcarata]